MIEKALKYIVGLNAPVVKEIGGQTYSDKSLHRIKHNPKAEPITLNTLSSLVDYIQSEYDKFDKVFVHIASPTLVQLYSVLDDDREREYLVNVQAQLPSFRFDDFIGHEEFCINLQSKFKDNEDRALLLKFAGTVEAGTVANYSDDGVSQKATIKQGVAGKQDALVPSPVCLVAYRTFVELEQPTTKFIFRLKQYNGGGVGCGLFQADGGAWKLEAMETIRHFLEDELEGVPNLVILS